MQVCDVMTADPACCTPDTRIREVAKLMVEHDCGVVPVVEQVQHRKPVGVVTDRDIAIRLVAEDRDPRTIAVEAAMTRATVTVEPEADIEEAALRMYQNRLRRILVVDDDGICVGMLSLADVAGAMTAAKVAAVLEGVSRRGASPLPR